MLIPNFWKNYLSTKPNTDKIFISLLDNQAHRTIRISWIFASLLSC